jgi:acetylornithine deacetylase/succinyl-diaminopimelate desuccinylase-like protein
MPSRALRPPVLTVRWHRRLALEHLRRLIAINTQNPPGNELKTAQYFDSVFAAMPGVERHVLESGNGRANFVARLRAHASPPNVRCSSWATWTW